MILHTKNDIFLLQSLTEGCPISLLEAMSFGKICICSKVGDIPIIIEDGFDGFLLERVSKDDIIKKRLNFLSDFDITDLKSRKFSTNFAFEPKISSPAKNGRMGGHYSNCKIFLISCSYFKSKLEITIEK